MSQRQPRAIKKFGKGNSIRDQVLANPGLRPPWHLPHILLSPHPLSFIFFFGVEGTPFSPPCGLFCLIYVVHFISFNFVLFGKNSGFFIYLFIFIPFLLGFILILIQFLPHTHTRREFIFIFIRECVCVFIFPIFFPPGLWQNILKATYKVQSQTLCPVCSHTHTRTEGCSPTHTSHTHTMLWCTYIYLYIFIYIYTCSYICQRNRP